MFDPLNKITLEALIGPKALENASTPRATLRSLAQVTWCY
jgi:hypothetical protein